MKPGPPDRTDTALRDQGVVGLQIRQQGDTAEVRLSLRQGGGVVEASLRETGRGVEIQLIAGPEQQPLLNRVAEALTAGRDNPAFDLDGVSVDTQGDPSHPRRQRPRSASETEGSTPRRQRRSATPHIAAQPLPHSAGTSYLR